MIEVTVIIPFLNHIEITKRCLKSIYKNTQSESFLSYEIILIDDFSSETYDFREEEKLFSKFKVIRNEINQGFAKSCNRGAKEASNSYLIFLNNDTVALKGWLDGLLNVMENHRDVGLVGSKLLYPDDTIQHAGVAFNESGSPFHIYNRFPAEFQGANKLREFQAVTGACFMIKKDLFQKIGGFDERYLNGFEDVDLCFKVRKKGYKVLYNPNSCLYHFESQTRALDTSLNSKNVNLLKETWGTYINIDYKKFYEDDLDDQSILPEQLFQIKELVNKNKKLILAIWGAGSGGRHALTILKKVNINPDIFIDKNKEKWGTSIENYVVYDPSYLVKLKKDGKSVFVIIASLWFKEIEEEMIKLGMEPEKEFGKDTIFAI